MSWWQRDRFGQYKFWVSEVLSATAEVAFTAHGEFVAVTLTRVGGGGGRWVADEVRPAINRKAAGFSYKGRLAGAKRKAERLYRAAHAAMMLGVEFKEWRI